MSLPPTCGTTVSRTQSLISSSPFHPSKVADCTRQGAWDGDDAQLRLENVKQVPAKAKTPIRKHDVRKSIPKQRALCSL
jgi:hypothetical protein